MVECYKCDSCSNCSCNKEIVCFVNMLNGHIKQPVCFDEYVESNLNNFFFKCELRSELSVVRSSEIKGKCFMFKSMDYYYVIPLPTFELD